MKLKTKAKPGLVTSHVIGIDPLSKKIEILKSSRQESDAGNILYHPPRVNPLVALDYYDTNIWHKRAINLKALCTAAIGYDILPVDPQLDDYEDDKQYLELKSFLDQPNTDGEIFEELVKNWLIDYGIYGYGLLELVTGVGGKLAEIYNLRAYNVSAKTHYRKIYLVQKTKTEQLFRFYGKDYSDEAAEKYNEALLIKNYDPKNKVFGLPDWYPATGDLIGDRSIVEYRIRKFSNNLMITFLIIIEGGELGKDSLDSLKEYLRTNHKGIDNAGRVAYLQSDRPDVKIKIEKIESEQPEQGYLQSREQHRDFVLASHGVASILLGAKTKGQLGGTTEIKDLFKIFNETMIRPTKRVAEKLLNRVIAERLKITDFKIEFKELTIDTLKEMVDYVTKMKQADVIDKNEARREFNYDPVEDFADDLIDDDVEKSLHRVNGLLETIQKKMTP